MHIYMCNFLFSVFPVFPCHQSICFPLLQVQLQQTLQSTHVHYFLSEVSDWQRRLTVADAVLRMWLEVQRTWAHLERIFMGSGDISQQLPEHTHKFQDIDADFKVARTHLCLYVVLASIAADESTVLGDQERFLCNKKCSKYSWRIFLWFFCYIKKIQAICKYV